MQSTNVNKWEKQAVSYLLQHADRVPTALQSGGETGCGGRVVILCRFRQKLRHRYLIWHPKALFRPEKREKCRFRRAKALNGTKQVNFRGRVEMLS